MDLNLSFALVNMKKIQIICLHYIFYDNLRLFYSQYSIAILCNNTYSFQIILFNPFSPFVICWKTFIFCIVLIYLLKKKS